MTLIAFELAYDATDLLVLATAAFRTPRTRDARLVYEGLLRSVWRQIEMVAVQAKEGVGGAKNLACLKVFGKVLAEVMHRTIRHGRIGCT